MAIEVLGLRVPTLDDIACTGRVLVRLDLNSPIKDGKILDDTRFKAHLPTIRELLDKSAGIVLLSHQGRPGEDDFTSLDIHASLLSELLGIDVEFIPDVIGPAAIERIKKVKPGDVVLLDNTRIYSEDYVEAPPEVHAKSIFVKRLSPHFDCFVNDAFSAAHRSQASIVGLPLSMPSAAGRLMEAELRAVSKALESGRRPRVFVLGGSKLKDMIKVIEYLYKSGAVDEILTTGLTALLFIAARGENIGSAIKFIEKKGGPQVIERARRLIGEGAPIRVPVDFVVEDNESIEVMGAHELRGWPKDIGPETINEYSKVIKSAGTVVMKGPAGVVEDERFRNGTVKLVEAALESGAFTIFGGGHLNMILSLMPPELRRRAGHVSVAGGALLYILAGEALPGVVALHKSWQIHGG